jgi:hypothetical protein
MASLSVRRHTSVDAFEAVALPFLLEREAENNLLIGICGQIKAGRYTDAYLATVERNGEVVGARLPYLVTNVGLSYTNDPGTIRNATPPTQTEDRR